ncbi:sodium/calcium exchanger NCL-like [Cornus florida]|uniref:sodium/calcium exchanger NCL-like n=1 Tax=Cornus florida TaxID=4283 RepID=UPI00289B0CBC|nr:sodium/calcium exchanger NCL-like [Cornus florida]
MAQRRSLTLLSTILLFLILCTLSTGRPSSDLISDSVQDGLRGPQFLQLNRFFADESCDQTYGFLPCTTTVLGNLFLIIVYGYLMFLAATYLYSGSELLLELLGPGLVGGLLLPTLGALPDAMLILVSGISGSTETAESQISVGMGLLAGSTVMLLTVVWGTCVVVGKCDLDQDSIARDGKDTKGFSLTESGVSTDIWTSYTARIMAISVVPFLVVQLPQLLNSTSGRHFAVLIGLIISFSLLVSYCVYQVFQPWIQSRRLDFAKHKHVKAGILKHLGSFEKFHNDDGTVNQDIVEKLFKMIDGDNDGFISYAELRALIVGIQFDNVNLDQEDAVDKVMKDFDILTRDSKVDKREFKEGIERWFEEAKCSGDSSHEGGPGAKNYLDDYHKQTKREHYLLGGQSDEATEGAGNPRWTIFKAVLLLLLGIVIAAAFANPLVDAVGNFSDATSIPSFFISFIVLPMATSSDAVTEIIFASQKKERSASLAFSELYGAVTMTNTLSLSVFLGLVYVRGLSWDFSSEVLVILIVCLVMGAFASFHTTFPLWSSAMAFVLYPFSLALVYVLDTYLGWT